MAFFTLMLIALTACQSSMAFPIVEFVYHNYTSLTDAMAAVNSEYLQYTHLYSIGRTVQNRELWVMAIAGSDPHKHVAGRPEVKFVGNMHGNEVVGRELLLQFIERVLVGYTHNFTLMTELLDNTRVHILPSMNPDGFEEGVMTECDTLTGRYNGNGLDLNRNFPDYFEENTAEIQPETQAIMDWVEEIPFILSANFHGGALVANYPFDNLDPAKKVEDPPYPYSMSPDDDIFRNLSLVYSKHHKNMHNITYNNCAHVFGGEGSNYTEGGFVDGITNGAEWYPIRGGMQDYNYIEGGCMEILLEVSCCKYPDESELPTFWDWNKRSMIEYLKQVHRGVKGQVVDINNNTVAGATVSVDNRSVTFRTADDGYYWRILMPGDYVIKVEKNGATAEMPVTVSSAVYNVTVQNFQLDIDVNADASTVPRLPRLVVLSFVLLVIQFVRVH